MQGSLPGNYARLGAGAQAVVMPLLHTDRPDGPARSGFRTTEGRHNPASEAHFAMSMYSTCLFCHRDLGRNEAIELFPIGRRLAFDADRGRLWVICRRCERWNLSPLELRWEVVEACERRFRDTRTRVSTDNIGLARLPEGLDLVRIGRPNRPEFAAWRYGDQFGKRRSERSRTRRSARPPPAR